MGGQRCYSRGPRYQYSGRILHCRSSECLRLEMSSAVILWCGGWSQMECSRSDQPFICSMISCLTRPSRCGIIVGAGMTQTRSSMSFGSHLIIG
ncbi:hypothetical protein LINPERPRIM_LOCUS21587 [Linum perenne]